MVKAKSESARLSDIVIKGIQDKKGIDIISLNLTKIEYAVANYFIICHGSNRPQVEAIADSVMEIVKKETGMNPWHKEGIENAEWILLDYVDVVVHIFQDITRNFYKLENLWADAETQRYENAE